MNFTCTLETSPDGTKTKTVSCELSDEYFTFDEKTRGLNLFGNFIRSLFEGLEAEEFNLEHFNDPKKP